MTVTVIDSHNKLSRFIQEFVPENLISPYMGDGLTSIIPLRSELKVGAARRGPATTVGTASNGHSGPAARRYRRHLERRRNCHRDCPSAEANRFPDGIKLEGPSPDQGYD
jgi:hypothetical protein